jgi:hypothetical protein
MFTAMNELDGRTPPSRDAIASVFTGEATSARLKTRTRLDDEHPRGLSQDDRGALDERQRQRGEETSAPRDSPAQDRLKK